MARQLCRKCDGPLVRCSVCHHDHCDDTTCPGMPVACALALEEDPVTA